MNEKDYNFQMTLLRFLLCLGVAYSLSLSEESNAHAKERKSLWYQGSQLLDGSQSSLAVPEGRNLQEVCNLDANSSFQIKIILDFYGNPFLLSQEEEDLIGETIKLVYNEQVECTENNFRQIAAVSKMPTTFVDQGNRDFSLSYTVSGSCRGCNSIMTLFEYSDREEIDTCPCQGPSSMVFNVFFRSEFNKLVRERKLTSVTEMNLISELADTPECPAYSTLTSSDVVLQFYGCLSKLSESDFQSIATLFRETYNLINGINAKMCDRFFRRIESAKVILPSNDNVQCPGYFEIRLDITAQCRGCDKSTFTLFDKEVDSNFFESFDDDSFDDVIGDDIPNNDEPITDDSIQSDDSVTYDDDTISWRHLDGVARNLASSGTSKCQCPLDPLFRAITDSEMADAYNLALSPLNLALECWGVVEVQQVTCEPTVQEFQTEVEITIESNRSLSQASVNSLTRDFTNSYNRLTQRYCDPYFREIQNAKGSSIKFRRVRDRSLQSKQVKKKISKVKVIIKGDCRGCPPKSPVFGNDAIKTRQLQVSSNSSSILALRNVNIHQLQTDDQCFCAINRVANSTPTEREFVEAFSKDIGNTVVITKVQETNVGDNGKLVSRKECEIDNDCVAMDKGTLCVNNQCLHKGNPRVTLTWKGDDDLDLAVVTPEGTVIDFSTDFDHVTGGSFDTLYSQDGNGLHVESIFFPITGGPSGNYKIKIGVYEQRKTPDNWTLKVIRDSKDGAIALLSVSSSGPRNNLNFYFGDSVSGELDKCSKKNGYVECCQDSDCQKATKRCVNRQCITEAARRFTLTWFGDDAYNLVVVTPNSQRLSTWQKIDSDSGGVFEDDKNKAVQARVTHTESVYFPPNSPLGKYQFFVETYKQKGLLDDWKLEATVQGKSADVKTGAGTSKAFSIVAVQCKINTDCRKDQVCLNNRCMTQGTLRFTLTWEGYDDFDISVKTPKGKLISWDNPKDAVSSGFREDDFDYTSFKHAESVVFGANGARAPVGMYQAFVKIYSANGNVPNNWRLSVNVKGKEVKVWRQTGEASFTWKLV